MRALITGASGTVGTALQQYLRDEGNDVIAWDRQLVAIDDFWQMEAFVRETQPDVLYHLAIASQSTGKAGESWLVNYEWSSELAWITRQLGIPFVFTSTAMVFSDHHNGPFTVDSNPDREEGYGYEKRRAEQRVLYQNPDARVLRLGWQIGEAAGSNNMIDFLENEMTKNGSIQASIHWYPACAFLPDTARALEAVAGLPGGLYMADANEHWTFYEIACALNHRHGDLWDIEESEDFVYDQRMLDERVPIASLRDQLPELPFLPGL